MREVQKVVVAAVQAAYHGHVLPGSACFSLINAPLSAERLLPPMQKAETEVGKQDSAAPDTKPKKKICCACPETKVGAPCRTGASCPPCHPASLLHLSTFGWRAAGCAGRVRDAARPRERALREADRGAQAVPAQRGVQRERCWFAEQGVSSV